MIRVNFYLNKSVFPLELFVILGTVSLVVRLQDTKDMTWTLY